MTGPVGVAIIGAGNISGQYLTHLQQYPDVRVHAIADLDAERARNRADEFGIEARDIEQILADPAIEIVVNLTIPAVHAELATRIVDAGKHAWTEKPFALDRAEGAALLAHAHTADRRVATAPDTVLGPAIQGARRLLESGAIGVPHAARILVQGPGPEAWHPDPAFLFGRGGGPLFDLGPYHLTALVQMFGPITRVTARTTRAQDSRRVGSGPLEGTSFPVIEPTTVTALIDCASGVSAVAVFTVDAARSGVEFEVLGSEGVLVIPDPNLFAGDLIVERRGEDPVTHAADTPVCGRGIGVVDLARSLRAGEPERANGEIGYHVLDVMQAIIESGDRAQPVDVTSTATVRPALTADWNPAERTLP